MCGYFCWVWLGVLEETPLSPVTQTVSTTTAPALTTVHSLCHHSFAPSPLRPFAHLHRFHPLFVHRCPPLVLSQATFLSTHHLSSHQSSSRLNVHLSSLFPLIHLSSSRSFTTSLPINSFLSFSSSNRPRPSTQDITRCTVEYTRCTAECTRYGGVCGIPKSIVCGVSVRRRGAAFEHGLKFFHKFFFLNGISAPATNEETWYAVLRVCGV